MTPSLRIIHIMADTPPYEEYADKPRPEINWDTKEGSWVGIWGYDWADLLGIESRKYDQSIVYEIWQPDVRADEIYSREIFPGVTHRLFPATRIKAASGMKLRCALHSSKMLEYLIRHVNSGPKSLVIKAIENTPFSREIARAATVPVLHLFLGLPRDLVKMSPSVNPLKCLNRFLVVQGMKRYLQLRVDYLLIGDYLPIDRVLMMKYVKRKVYSNLIGLNFPKMTHMDQAKAKKILQIASSEFVLFTSSRLVSIKQVDKLISVLKKLKDSRFKLYVSGHGVKKYENELRQLVQKLRLADRVIFLGYLDNRTLELYYSACDLYINVSLNDGGPMSAWKALAYERPVLNSDIGNVYHFLQENNAGIIVGRRNYKQWEAILKKILHGEIGVNTLPRSRIEALLNWKQCARNYIAILNDVVSDYLARGRAANT